MITLEREKIVEIPFCGSKVVFRYKVPNAIETEEIFNSKAKNTEIFKRFTLEIGCSDCEEINGKFPSDLVAMPGTYALVSNVANEIIKSATLSEEEKN